MKTIHILIGALLLVSNLACLHHSTKVISQTHQNELAIPTEKALLWEISGNELTERSYLFGTIHIINREDYFFTPTMEKALEDTKGVAFEIDMEDMTDMTKIMGMMSSMYMKDNKTLKDLLTDEEYETVNTHFQKMGLPLMLVERIKPMFLSMMASGGEDMMGGFSMDGDTASSMVSYEMELMEKAKAQEKEVFGLETMEFQMSLFDSIPYEAQAKMLMSSIESDDSKESKNQLDEMVKLYKDQDIQGMQNLMGNDPDALGGYEDLLLQKRNRNWIPIMVDMMAEHSVFFAVGAGHLGGEEGVISLLRQKGYEVKAVSE